jgi:hypothetical protein
MVSPQLGLKEGEQGKGKVSGRGPVAEVIPGGKAGRPNINSKGDICVGFREAPVGGRGLLEGVEPSLGVILR